MSYESDIEAIARAICEEMGEKPDTIVAHGLFPVDARGRSAIITGNPAWFADQRFWPAWTNYISAARSVGAKTGAAPWQDSFNSDGIPRWMFVEDKERFATIEE